MSNVLTYADLDKLQIPAVLEGLRDGDPAEGEIKQLISSIQDRKGLLSPLVYTEKDGKFFILSGILRLFALKAIVAEVPDFFDPSTPVLADLKKLEETGKEWDKAVLLFAAASNLQTSYSNESLYLIAQRGKELGISEAKIKAATAMSETHFKRINAILGNGKIKSLVQDKKLNPAQATKILAACKGDKRTSMLKKILEHLESWIKTEFEKVKDAQIKKITDDGKVAKPTDHFVMTVLKKAGLIDHWCSQVELEEDLTNAIVSSCVIRVNDAKKVVTVVKRKIDLTELDAEQLEALTAMAYKVAKLAGNAWRDASTKEVGISLEEIASLSKKYEDKIEAEGGEDIEEDARPVATPQNV